MRDQRSGVCLFFEAECTLIYEAQSEDDQHALVSTGYDLQETYVEGRVVGVSGGTKTNGKV
jgi:hypothetical protein